MSIAFLYLSAGASPRISTGLCGEAAGGNALLSSSMVLSSSLAITKPCFSTASVAKTPAPPPLVTIATLFPRGIGFHASALSIKGYSHNSSISNAPACFIAASYTLYAPARLPVCEATALTPCSLLPAFKMTTGL